MALNPVGSPASGIGPTPECHAHTPVLATVDGTTYVANVNDSAGMYIAQDPAIFGAEGTGPTAQAAEEAFRNRIDLLA
ncbi:MAG TPA: hypothetical protein VHE33_03495 [Acidobacteriaceae bacterium]|nr:hypothetical protein [Acidobacteriaceae bacterium]